MASIRQRTAHIGLRCDIVRRQWTQRSSLERLVRAPEQCCNALSASSGCYTSESNQGGVAGSELEDDEVGASVKQWPASLIRFGTGSHGFC